MAIIDAVKINLDAERLVLNRINELKKKLLRKNLPKGNLLCRFTGTHDYYYFRPYRSKKSVYIKSGKKSGRKMIEDLKLERFLDQYIAALEHNIALQEQFLNEYIFTDFEHLNETLPKAYQYHFGDRAPLISQWKGGESQNPYHPEGLRFRTKFGLLVRSKSELIIAELLFDLGIGFNYESPLDVRIRTGKFKTIYPDFTIPCANGQKIYWEHKGMMNDEEYFWRDQSKMQIYQLNGIYPPKNLIVTHDGNDGSLDTQDLLLLINGLILPRL